MTPLERAWRGGRSDWKLHVLSVFSVAVAFVCMAAALLVVVNVQSLRDAWARSGRASIYLKPETTRDAAAEIETALRAAAKVRTVRYVSSDDARHEILDGRADAIVAKLPSEAFPASLEVSLTDDASQSVVQKIAETLSALPAVESVETYQSWTERLASVLRGGVLAAALLAAVVLAAVVSVVASTIRLTLQRRRLEVEVMKLIGATDEYVRRPFIIEGAVQGALGSLLAMGLVGALFLIVRSRFDAELGALVGITPSFLPWHVAAGMVLIGGALGAVAAYGSLRKLLLV
ncbi:MAG TPA: permease-like cell division protein FtsX [Polyangiaceae bacterium]|jgi:cell division transport system permease protein|nr:permease-like cell division protein FtsX [Polyangiaceae bacterium]